MTAPTAPLERLAWVAAKATWRDDTPCSDRWADDTWPEQMHRVRAVVASLPLAEIAESMRTRLWGRDWDTDDILGALKDWTDEALRESVAEIVKEGVGE